MNLRGEIHVEEFIEIFIIRKNREGVISVFTKEFSDAIRKFSS